MTKTITIMTGSVRPNSVGDQLVPLVQAALEEAGANVQLADMKELQLPFFDSPVTPVAEEYAPTNESVLAWQKLVKSSDGMVMLVPEYNYHMSAVQKNAIDWLYTEWKDKPVAAISYGWGGGELSYKMLDALLQKVEANLQPEAAHLYFAKDISPAGELIDETEVNNKITAALKQLLA